VFVAAYQNLLVVGRESVSGSVLYSWLIVNRNYFVLFHESDRLTVQLTFLLLLGNWVLGFPDNQD